MTIDLPTLWIAPRGRAPFSASFASPTPNSVVVLTSELEHGEIVDLEILGARFRGHVAFVLRQPIDLAVIALAPGFPDRASFREMIDRTPMMNDRTFAFEDHAATVLSRTEPSARAADLEDTERTGDRTTSAAPVVELPVLDPVTLAVRFASRDQYRAQHRANISRGSIVARSPPFPSGARRALEVSVPGDSVRVECKVAFNGQGVVAFTIVDPDRTRARLEALTLDVFEP